MTTQYRSGRRDSSGTLVALLLSLILGAAALDVFIRHATTGILARVSSAITGRTGALSNLREGGREFNMEKKKTVIVTGDSQAIEGAIVEASCVGPGKLVPE